MRINKEDQKLLLDIAREAISGNQHKAIRKQREEKQPGILQKPYGAFVSLYHSGKLRGCIGTFSEDRPLHENVRNMAISAATSDTRFDPLDASELEQVQIEISILSPRVRVNDVSEIIPGKHGIFMKRGTNRGTFLPQVALSQNWNREEFLGNCAKYKAGIGWDGWKTAELYRYEAFVFSSADLDGVVKKT
jgi:AmmeMemoRadiSam system protein A